MMKSASFADIQLGDEVEIEEHYADAFFHFRGKVIEGGFDVVVVGGPGHRRGVMGVHEDRTALKVWVKQPDPPTTVGSVVKYYDSGFLCFEVAHFDGDGRWFNLRQGQVVELDRLDWTVLFDAAKDS